MTEQQRPDEDVEGHRRHFFGARRGPSRAESAEDDVEGHRRRLHLDPEASGDDVEGHSNVARRPL